ncbi:sugar ABC transporter ATP-binding protein [Subtercola sp. YIM 133946]|uniref:sugar ABC transporter ATP-binding protein n=1 Tax=Subtercola sp. YIM 133946 TaxID=3118909 RepID=UPI002F94F5AE
MTSELAPPRLVVEGLSKTFPGQRALEDASLTVAAGEVHALLGQNGSGKSTLIKVLAGYHQPDPGATAAMDGQPLELGSAAAAHAAGIRFIHQDLALIADLSVTDNLALGGSYRSKGWISDRRETAAAQQLLDEWGVSVDAKAPLRTLGQADRTMVAIVRAVRDGVQGGGMVVLDEPTASLPSHEVEYVSSLVRQLRDRGTSILYVTHRLSEVFQLADTVTVLRDGRVTGSRAVAGMDHDGLVAMIIGRSLGNIYPEVPQPLENAVLTVENIRGASVRHLSLQVREREIVGIAGLTGSGREAVTDLVFGMQSRDEGTVRVSDAIVPADSPKRSIAAGLALLPADRKGLGSIPELTVRENVTLPGISTGPGFWLSTRAESREVGDWLKKLGVVPGDPERPLATLSGGNQQRALITRWLRCKSKVFLMDEPTQGVDIQAKVAIYGAIRDAAHDGASVLVASTDNDELAAICDRVIVMRDGLAAITLTGDRLTSEAILEHSIERALIKEGK